MKPNLILLHAALGTKDQLEKIKHLLSDDFQTYSFNFSGHGGRPQDHPFSIEGFAQDLIAFMNSEGLEQAHVFGYSMGAYVALQASINYPQRILSITSYGTKFDWNPEAAAKEVKFLNPQITEEKVPHFAQKLAQAHDPGDWKVNMKNTAQMMLDLANGQRLEDDDLRKIITPVSIGIGSEDQMVSLAESSHAAEQLNGALMQLEGGVHPIEKNDPQWISNFISKAIMNMNQASKP